MSAGSASARRSAPDFRGESPGIVWNPGRLDPSALASVSMGYQVGVTPLQMAAAVSSVANGGSLLEPRVVRAVIKDGQRAPVAHKIAAPHRLGPHRGRAHRPSWRQSSSAARPSPRQVEGYTIAGKTGTAAKLVNGRYSKSRLQRLVRRLPAVAPAGHDHYRGDRLAARRSLRRRHGRRADLQAHRRSVAAPPGCRADDQRVAAGAVARHDVEPRRRCRSRCATAGVVDAGRHAAAAGDDAGPART